MSQKNELVIKRKDESYVIEVNDELKNNNIFIYFREIFNKRHSCFKKFVIFLCLFILTLAGLIYTIIYLALSSKMDGGFMAIIAIEAVFDVSFIIVTITSSRNYFDLKKYLEYAEFDLIKDDIDRNKRDLHEYDYENGLIVYSGEDNKVHSLKLYEGPREKIGKDSDFF